MVTLLRSPLSRLEYVKRLALAGAAPRYPGASVLSLTPESQSAKVVDGSTASFVSGIPLGKQQDVLNSTLLAQLGANAAFDREKETVQWYEKYREVLVNVGWISDAYQFELQQDAGSTIQLDTKSLDTVAALASGNELNLLTETLNALEDQDPDSNAATIFDTGGSAGEGGNFQLGAATLDQNQNVVLVSGAFYFEAAKHERRFLFVTWESDSINFYAGVQRSVLNEQIYATVRQAIIVKLGDLAQQYVADLPI